MEPVIYVDVSIFEREHFGRGIDRVITKFFEGNTEAIRTGTLVPIYWHPEYGYLLATNTLEKFHKPVFNKWQKFVQKLAPYAVPEYLLVKIKNRQDNKYSWVTEIIKLDIQKDDTVFSIDSNWSLEKEYTEYLEQLHKKGVNFIPLFYDLISLTHPQHLLEVITQGFEDWLNTVLKISNYGLSISNSTAEEVQNYAKKHKQKIKITTTYLGSDFNKNSKSEHVPKRLVDIFQQDSQPTYVVLGSIEPRKNHKLIFECFEKMWAKGYRGKLMFVGRMTPLYADLDVKIKYSKYTNDLMFVEQGMNDSDLAFCLANCNALISASHAEGFDLPVVEASKMGATLLLSDIAVHKEIAGNNATYFDSNSMESFKKAINKVENMRLKKRGVSGWMSWDESSKNMYTTLREIVK